jgi:hypothetical protein
MVTTWSKRRSRVANKSCVQMAITKKMYKSKDFEKVICG